MQTEIIQLHSLQEICAALTRFAPTLPSLSGGPSVRQTFAEKFYKYGVVLALRDVDEITAFAAFYCNDLQKRCGYLSMLAVMPEARGCGNGKKLLAHVCRSCREAGMSRLKLEVSNANEPAMRLYKSMGFVMSAECTDHSVYMEKELQDCEQYGRVVQ